MEDLKRPNLAVAFAMKKKRKKMAEGGVIEDLPAHKDEPLPDDEMSPKRRALKAFAEGGDTLHRGAMESRKYGSQKEEKGVHSPRMPYPGSKESFGESYAGYVGKSSGGVEARTGKSISHQGMLDESKKEHLKKLAELKSMPSGNLKGLAEGGMVDMGEQSDAHDEDMVDRIMARRMPREEDIGLYSEGGRVANEEGIHADERPNEFDDLALRDNLEFSYDAKNSGDELGSKLNQDDDHEDMIGRIMKKRAR